MSTDATFRALRAIRVLLPDCEVMVGPESVDESYAGAYTEAPRLQRADCVEGSTVRAMRVIGDPEVRFAAFLDGIQRVQFVSHQTGIPIALGTVAAAVRLRLNRRLTAWGHRKPLASSKLYMPLMYLPCGAVEEICGWPIVDTSFVGSTAHGRTGPPVSRHPAALRAVALESVRTAREQAETGLAELWCAGAEGPIYIDGGISSSAEVATSPLAIGVIKSHQTIYAEGGALDAVLSLRRGERSSVFRISSERRSEVASWYLRLRDPRGHDAMFGLVRLEVAVTDDVTARANDVSRWVMAEAAPLALPDSRWDRMAYGIRDCEEFLRATAS